MKLFFYATLILFLSSCFLSPYQIDVNQGNLISEKQISKLKIGMTKNQIKFLLGTPLVDDFLRGGSWYYVYASGDPEKINVNKQLKLSFDPAGLLAV